MSGRGCGRYPEGLVSPHVEDQLLPSGLGGPGGSHPPFLSPHPRQSGRNKEFVPSVRPAGSQARAWHLPIELALGPFAASGACTLSKVSWLEVGGDGLVPRQQSLDLAPS